MIVPKLQSIFSVDLQDPGLPADPSNCSILLEVEIGSDGSGADTFSFTVITPAAFARAELPRWGRGHLVVAEFDWAVVRRSIERLLAHAARETWDQVAAELNKELGWEFEGYTAG